MAQTIRGDTGAFALTPAQIVGPFYPVGESPDQATDLARPIGSTAEANGQIICIMGRVLTSVGIPVPHARMEVWQANAAGKYRHPSDTNPAPLDPHFKGFARFTTDAFGRYSFRTIKPGGYPTADGNVRPPHIHLTVEGQFDRLVTQLYFAGEAENKTDPWLNSVPHPERLIVRLQEPAEHVGSDALLGHFDIVLPSG